MTIDVDQNRIKEKAVRIRALLSYNGNPPMTFSNVAKIVLGKYKGKDVKKVVNGVIKQSIEYSSDSWDFTTQYPKRNVQNSAIIKTLQIAESIIQSTFLEYCQNLERFPNSEERKDLHKTIDNKLKGRVEVIEGQSDIKTDNFLIYIANYINDCLGTNPKRTMLSKENQKVPYKKRSTQSFLNTLNKLIAFKGGQELTFKDLKDDSMIKALPVLKFSEIDLKFYNSLQTFLADQGLKVNYFGSQVKYIKKFMTTSMSEGYHTNLTYKDREFTKQATKADNVSLTAEQLDALQNYDLSDNPMYDNARDLFLVGCWTGLRYSDYSRLTRDNVKGRFIDILTQKTSKQVVIPILKPLQRILDKYKDTESGFPRTISDVKLNAYIKDICKIVGEKIDKSFLKVDTVNSALISGNVTEEVPFWSRISTHCGRRSFCTNAVRLNIPKSIIMAISGHTTEKSFDLYVGISSREFAEMLSTYFKNAGL